VVGSELDGNRYPVRRTPNRAACGTWLSPSNGTKFADWSRPGHEVALGADGTVGQEGDAVSQQGRYVTSES